MKSWKLKALRDPELKQKHWMLLKVGPTTLGDLIEYAILRLRYQFKEY